jgi:hypothetical protein
MKTKTNTQKRQTRKVGVAGGFINQMMGNNSTLPEVGKGATLLSYSDRSAYEVTEVSEDGLTCKIRSMNCTFIGSGYGDERYTYESDLESVEYTLEWNTKKGCWGKTWNTIMIIKSLQNKLIKKYGYGWDEFLPVPYKTLIDGKEELGIHTKLKLVKGVTKEYKEFHKVSVIFGLMEQYRDPSF